MRVKSLLLCAVYKVQRYLVHDGWARILLNILRNWLHSINIFLEKYSSIYKRALQATGRKQPGIPVNVCNEPSRAISIEGMESPVKAVAFYLPQFHPFPENDEWWGEGFTEWTNVAKATPQFEGHYQPRLPSAMGFYDLRLPEVMERQTELAKQFGINGFCFHHYYFNGKRLMERPVDNLLNHPEIDFPFMLCWANENWTRRWDGRDQDVLISQKHSAEDDIVFLKDIGRYFSDSRYIRVNGKPFFIVYNVSQLPDPAATVARWRAYWKEERGEELYIVMAQTFGEHDPNKYGFDGAVEFPPNTLPACNITAEFDVASEFSGGIYSYKQLTKDSLKVSTTDFPLFKTVFPQWDNTARRGSKSHIFEGSTPEQYAKWLSGCCECAKKSLTAGEQFVFINAWNEWAEGAHLEPCSYYGYAYLNATQEALLNGTQVSGLSVAVVIHCYYVDLLTDLLSFVDNIPAKVTLLVSVREGNRKKVEIQLKESGFEHFIIKEVPNYGFDIAPMLCAFKNEILKFDLVCKIHTKKTLHNAGLKEWRNDLLTKMLGSEHLVRRCLAEFITDETLGVLYPENFAPIAEYLKMHARDSMRGTDSILTMLGVQNLNSCSAIFPAGSFYWFRPEALKALFDYPWGTRDFEEKGLPVHLTTGKPVDKTTAHFIERAVCYLARSSGYSTCIMTGAGEFIDDQLGTRSFT